MRTEAGMRAGGAKIAIKDVRKGFQNEKVRLQVIEGLDFHGVPIFVADKVMDEAAFLPENEEEGAEAGAGTPPKGKEVKLTKLEALRAQLKESIEREDYERAASLRDEIRKLEQRH